MNKKMTLLLGVLLVLVNVGASLLYNKLAENSEPDKLTSIEGTDTDIGKDEEEDKDAVRTEAPDFTVYDNDGNEVKLSAMKGKPVVLNFWASWCPPCKNEMPDFEEVFAERGDDITFMMVNLTDGYQETEASAKKFLASKDYTFPVYFDKDIDAAMKYGISAVPQTFFIDEEGYLVVYAKGAIDKETLLRGIEMLDAEQTD